MSQEIKCTDCNTVLATLNTKTFQVKPVTPGKPQFQLSDGPQEVICPGCGKANTIN